MLKIRHELSDATAADLEWRGKDAKNIEVIRRAFADGRIDPDSRDYLESLYGDGMRWQREMFHMLGKYLGAPKTQVFRYNLAKGRIRDLPVKITGINPGHSYLVHHRFDADPMRNQFFRFDASHEVELSVSSIVTVIVGAQKNVARAIEKITTGRYYDNFTNEVAETAARVLGARGVAKEIKKRFAEKYITNAAAEVPRIIGPGHGKAAAKLARELDRIKRPQHRLQDVYRVKCLFDMVPQVRAFIDGIVATMPDRVLMTQDTFSDASHSRNYRSAKIILNIGAGGKVVPLEIMCLVRTFFDFERQSHDIYSSERSKKPSDRNYARTGIIELHESGIREYNLIVHDCTRQLFDRIGWNILYSRGEMSDTLFDGFPRVGTKPYPDEAVEAILDKLKTKVKRGTFKIDDAPRKLSPHEEQEIFGYMAKFILASALPYAVKAWKIKDDDIETRLFNFIMAELFRYYKNA